MLRGPIIGYGNVAETGHMPFWRACPDAEIVAVVDNDPARRALFVANDPRRRSYTVLADLLAAERLDFVDICTSPSSHAALIEQALTAKLHVLCEKLLTIAADDTLPIARMAEAAGCVVHTGHNWLAAPVSRQVFRLLAEGQAGQLRSVEC